MKGAFHSSELWFMFNSLEHSDRPFTKADWALAERIITHWTNFAKTGDPGNGWEAFTADNPNYMVFKVNADETADASAMGQPVAREN